MSLIEEMQEAAATVATRVSPAVVRIGREKEPAGVAVAAEAEAAAEAVVAAGSGEGPALSSDQGLS